MGSDAGALLVYIIDFEPTGRDLQQKEPMEAQVPDCVRTCLVLREEAISRVNRRATVFFCHLHVSGA